MPVSSFHTLLEDGDVDMLMACWKAVAPHLPQPQSRMHAEITMHMARTVAESVTFKLRAYSHAWLVERSLPSQLPDHLKPRAERIYPRVVSAVMIGGKVRNPYFQPAVDEAHKAMQNAVLDAEADGKLEHSAFVRTRMLEAREKTYKQLFGALTPQV